MSKPTTETLIAPRPLYLAPDGRMVEGNDPSRVSLLARAGEAIPEHEVKRLGLTAESLKPPTPAPAPSNDEVES